MNSEDPAWHNDDIHVMWTPPRRCLTCGGHRVASVRGKCPIATHRLGLWAMLAEYPMRLLARSLLKKDSRTWTMEEDAPQTFGTDIHAQIEQYNKELGPE